MVLQLLFQGLQKDTHFFQSRIYNTFPRRWTCIPKKSTNMDMHLGKNIQNLSNKDAALQKHVHRHGRRKIVITFGGPRGMPWGNAPWIPMLNPKHNFVENCHCASIVCFLAVLWTWPPTHDCTLLCTKEDAEHGKCTGVFDIKAVLFSHSWWL